MIMILLVGERMNLGRTWRPRSSSDDSVELRLRLGAFRTPASARRLRETGVTWDRAVNLLWPSTSRSWDAHLARRVADLLLERDEFHGYLLAGRRVAESFGLHRAAIPSRWELAGRPALVLPHPSGLCRLWNDPSVSAEVGRLFREMMQDVEVAHPSVEETPPAHWAK